MGIGLTSAAPWVAFGASRCGPSHDHCQDSFALHITDDRVCLVVADGAGSAPRSATGSRLACDAALEELRSGYTDDAIARAVNAARTALGGDRDLAATLSVVFITATITAVAAIGDSPVVVVSHAGEVSLCTSPRRSEFANETEFLTSRDPVISSWEFPTNEVRAVALASDGIDFAAIGPHGPTPGFWLPLVDRAESQTLIIGDLLEFLDSRQLLDDDTTLVIAARVAETGP